MATVVIVHGAWDGGWYWKNIATRLREKNHEVYTPTLTGLGEREHLGNPATDLETHIQDIVNVIKFEELKDVILIGHSYGGVVVTGVAGRIPELLSEVIYLDAFILTHGNSLADLMDPTLLEQLTGVANQIGEGWYIPAMTGPNSDPRHTKQPLQTFYQKLNLENPEAWSVLKKTYIKCTAREDKPIYSALDQSAEFAQIQNWPYHELPTGHNPNDTDPERLTNLLLHLLD